LLCRAVGDERHVGVAVHVGEARRHRSALGVDRLTRGSADLPDRGDPAVRNRDRSLRGAPPLPSTICALVISSSADGAVAFGGT
jgi:hypothetical protein